MDRSIDRWESLFSAAARVDNNEKEEHAPEEGPAATAFSEVTRACAGPSQGLAAPAQVFDSSWALVFTGQHGPCFAPPAARAHHTHDGGRPNDGRSPSSLFRGRRRPGSSKAFIQAAAAPTSTQTPRHSLQPPSKPPLTRTGVIDRRRSRQSSTSIPPKSAGGRHRSIAGQGVESRGRAAHARLTRSNSSSSSSSSSRSSSSRSCRRQQSRQPTSPRLGTPPPAVAAAPTRPPSSR